MFLLTVIIKGDIISVHLTAEMAESQIIPALERIAVYMQIGEVPWPKSCRSKAFSSPGPVTDAAS
jgi:hypothetical protein